MSHIISFLLFMVLSGFLVDWSFIDRLSIGFDFKIELNVAKMEENKKKIKKDLADKGLKVAVETWNFGNNIIKKIDRKVDEFCQKKKIKNCYGKSFD